MKWNKILYLKIKKKTYYYNVRHAKLINYIMIYHFYLFIFQDVGQGDQTDGQNQVLLN